MHLIIEMSGSSACEPPTSLSKSQRVAHILRPLNGALHMRAAASWKLYGAAAECCLGEAL
jgi:hypothetical protein